MDKRHDTVSMGIYAIAIIPLILMILEITDEYQDLRTKAAAFADNLAAAGGVKGIKYWWDQLYKLGPKFGYSL